MTYFLLSGREPFFGNSIDEIMKLIKKGEFDFKHPVWENVSE